ncbi:MAG: 16S rRNA (guanine(966)-N(2))-methyltransferase RsmD [Candidatus Riflebacteria bacterium]|nr:16S rRNA (guanine(966)-N(2))-methyltransferase RsmD [Candidatus Riflebacteria bacterium]
MRVIAGIARGHNLKMPKGNQTRPAMDRVKGSLFSILVQRIEGARFLDLFAGSGGLGIEALSRGAEYSAFVDSSSFCIEAIKDNLIHTKLIEKAQIFQEDCLRFIKRSQVKPFDIVCIDPPYSKGHLAPILEILHVCSMFYEKTIFVIERRKKEELNLKERMNLNLIDEREFGETVLTFLKLFPTPNKS